MNEVLIRNWNEVVMPDDTVYHLGDVALGPWSEWEGILTRLNGFKVMVIGNHDRVFQNEKPRMRERFFPLYSSWFDVVTDNITNLGLNTVEPMRFVNLSHFPYEGDSHDGDRYTDCRLTDEGVPLIHGHIHKSTRAWRSAKGTPQVHVGVDAWDFRPVAESEVLSLLDSLS